MMKSLILLDTDGGFLKSYFYIETNTYEVELGGVLQDLAASGNAA